jgi:fructan beta-fructosidase
MKLCLLPFALVAFVAFALPCRAAEDVVFADFEGSDYGAWKTEGDAFGAGPARGPLPGQMAVEGFVGKGLVNSFNKGDDTLGTLTSPEFKIERRAISFLLGGGGWPGKTCVNLIVDGSVVRTALGPNTNPGGSERLEPQGWDVAELAGKMARIQIVDAAKGTWGHINVDQVVFTDKKPPVVMRNVTRELTLEKTYLHFPVKTGAKKHRVALLVDGKVMRDFEIELADDPEWWAHLDVSAWRGKKATVRVDWLAEDAKALESVTQADTIWHAEEVYREPQRAQFHFSPRRGWNNDPNGMVYANGEYHLYFQHNPYGWNWGNMHWGHAVSPDMVHWREEAIALYPPVYDDMAFSGSAVVDKANTSDWKKGDADLLVGAFTSTGRGECMVYSNDKGRTWQEFVGNPVVKHAGRDPKLLWYEPTKQWVMAVYDETDKKQWIAFYTSPDLKTWTFTSRIEGFFECPDFFELPLDGGAKKWVLTAASSEYRVGSFDGKTFTPETPKLPGHRGKGFYAAQTFSDEPKGRRVQIGWFQTATPGTAFNQAMSLPNELTLKATADGPRLAWQPVAELASLRGKQIGKFDGLLSPGADALKGAHGELLEIRAEFAAEEGTEIGFNVRGVNVNYDVKKQEINVNGHAAPAPLRNGRQRLIIYADRTNLEVFASDGLTYVPMPVMLDPKNTAVSVVARGGAVKMVSLEAYELKSSWPAASR